MRLVPPAAVQLPFCAPAVRRRVDYRLRRAGLAADKRFDLALELLNLRLQLLGPELAAALAARRQVAVVTPPVETDLLRLVQRADEQSDADGEKLDFREGDLDVARDHQPLVQHAIEDVDESRRAMVGW